MNRRKSNKSVITCIHWRNQENWLTRKKTKIFTLNTSFSYWLKRILGIGVWYFGGEEKGDGKASVWWTNVCWARQRPWDTETSLISKSSAHHTKSLSFSGPLSLVIALFLQQDHYWNLGKCQSFFLSFWIYDFLHLIIICLPETFGVGKFPPRYIHFPSTFPHVLVPGFTIFVLCV